MPHKPARFHADIPATAPSPAGDAARESEVATRLALAGGLDAIDISVTMVADAVVLAGSVSCAADRARAEDVLRRHIGGGRLDNRIRVVAGTG